MKNPPTALLFVLSFIILALCGALGWEEWRYATHPKIVEVATITAQETPAMDETSAAPAETTAAEAAPTMELPENGVAHVETVPDLPAPNEQVTQAPTQPGPQRDNPSPITHQPRAQGTAVNLGDVRMSNGTPLTFRLRTGQYVSITPTAMIDGRIKLSMTVRGMQNNGDTRSMSSPSLVTRPGQSVILHAGTPDNNVTVTLTPQMTTYAWK